MEITAEISLYPLEEKYGPVIDNFIQDLESREQIEVEAGVMSSLIRGEYHDVMRILEEEVFKVFRHNHAVINIKIANACEIK